MSLKDKWKDYVKEGTVYCSVTAKKIFPVHLTRETVVEYGSGLAFKKAVNKMIPEKADCPIVLGEKDVSYYGDTDISTIITRHKLPDCYEMATGLKFQEIPDKVFVKNKCFHLLRVLEGQTQVVAYYNIQKSVNGKKIFTA